ncbi:hypothetical protein MICRO8M_110314 [Microbacterium sp. 8M]|nr:hypothetical protein MICRO8M_110314 [Microbacterium sp. 8M]
MAARARRPGRHPHVRTVVRVVDPVRRQREVVPGVELRAAHPPGAAARCEPPAGLTGPKPRRVRSARRRSPAAGPSPRSPGHEREPVDAQHVTGREHEPERVLALLQPGLREQLLLRQPRVGMHVHGARRLVVQVHLDRALIRRLRPRHGDGRAREGQRDGVTGRLRPVHVVAQIAAEPEAQRGVAVGKRREVRGRQRHRIALDRVVGPLLQRRVAAVDAEELRRCARDVQRRRGRGGPIEGDVVHVDEALLHHVEPVQQHELPGLLHDPDRVAPVREVALAEHRLLRTPPLGLIRVDRGDEHAVDVHLCLPLGRMRLGDPVDAGADERILERAAVGLHVVHVVLIVAEASARALPPGAGVDDRRIRVVDGDDVRRAGARRGPALRGVEHRGDHVLRRPDDLFPAVARPRTRVGQLRIVVVEGDRRPLARREGVELGAVHGHVGGDECALGGARVLLGPEVAHLRRSRDADVCQRDGDVGVRLAEVEDADGDGSVRVVRVPDLPRSGGRDGMRRTTGLVHRDDLVVREQLDPVVVELRHVVADVERCGGHGPQRRRGAALVLGEPVHLAVADVERVEVVPPRVRPGVAPPVGRTREQPCDVVPLGERDVLAVALDIPFDPPPLGVLRPVVGIADVEGPGELEPDVVALQRLRPGLDVVPRVDGQVADAGSRRHAVELQEVDAPRAEEVGDGVDVLLRARAREVECVADAPVVRLLQRLLDDVGGGALRRAVDRKARLVDGVRDTGDRVEPDLLVVAVDVVDDRLQAVRVERLAGGGTTVLVVAVVPCGVDVDVIEAGGLQLLAHGVGLRDDLVRGDPLRAVARVDLHAVAAPPHVGVRAQGLVRRAGTGRHGVRRPGCRGGRLGRGPLCTQAQDADRGDGEPRDPASPEGAAIDDCHDFLSAVGSAVNPAPRRAVPRVDLVGGSDPLDVEEQGLLRVEGRKRHPGGGQHGAGEHHAAVGQPRHPRGGRDLMQAHRAELVAQPHPVALPRVEPREAHASGLPVRGGGQPRPREQRAGAVRGDDAGELSPLVGEIRVHHLAAVDQRAQLLVQPRPGDDHGELLRRGGGEVGLDAGVRGERHREPERQIGVARRRVRAGRAEMGADQLRRHQQAGPPLDARALDRVVAVRGPHPVGALQDAEVDASAAAGAGLDLETGMPVAQLVQHPVEGRGLRVHERAVTAFAPAHGLEQVAVVVPLEVVDAVPIDEGADALDDQGVGGRIRQVQHLLVARGGTRPLARRQDPLRVLAREIRVRVDHLGLEPQPELHPSRPHGLDERVEALRPDLFVDEPVPEPGVVAAAPPEPAVVEHDPLDTDLGSAVGELDESGEVVIEVHRLPCVQHEGARAARMTTASPEPTVETRREAVEAAVGPREQRGRRVVALARLQDHLTRAQQLAGADDAGQAAGAFGQTLGEVLPVAAPRQVRRPHLAAAETERRRPRDEEEGRVMARLAASSPARVRAEGEGQALGCALAAPLAREVEQLLGTLGQRQQSPQPVERVCARRVGRVLDRQIHGEHAGRVQTQLHARSRAGDAVAEAQGDESTAVRRRLGVHGFEFRPRRGGEARAVPRLRGGPRPAVPLTRPDGERPRHVGRVVQHSGRRGLAQCSDRVLIERPEIGAPVQHLRNRCGAVDDERRSGGSQDMDGTFAVRHRTFPSHLLTVVINHD